MGLFDDYALQSITITPRGTSQGDGTFAYDGTPVNTTGRVWERRGMVKDQYQKEHHYKYQVTVRASESVELQDQITFDGVTFEVRDIAIPRHLDAVTDHKVLLVG